MFIKNILILFFIGLTVSHANPILPDCIQNYTTFYNKYSNTSAILSNYTQLSGETCGKKCSLLNNCTSFNYFPEDIFDRTPSECVLLKSKYDPLLLVVKNNAGFFLKSKNDCSGSKAQTKNIGALILLLFLVGILFIVCLYSFMRKKVRSSYGEI